MGQGQQRPFASSSSSSCSTGPVIIDPCTRRHVLHPPQCTPRHGSQLIATTTTCRQTDRQTVVTSSSAASLASQQAGRHIYRRRQRVATLLYRTICTQPAQQLQCTDRSLASSRLTPLNHTSPVWCVH